MSDFINLLKRFPIVALVTVVLIILEFYSSAAGTYASHSLWDNIIHFAFGIFGSQALFIVFHHYEILGRQYDTKTHRRVQIAFTVLIVGMAMGAAYEIIEFSLDKLLGFSYQHGNLDTMQDLIADTLGALIGGIWLAARNKYH